MNISEHLKKDYWTRRVTPDSASMYPPAGNHVGYRQPRAGAFGVGYVNLTQDQFLNELSPAAHEINSKYMSQRPIYKAEKDETTGKTKIYPEAVKKGQYLFFYGLTKEEEQEKLTKFYRLPKGCEFVEVSNAFLRGTSMFTSETESLFKMYTGADRSTAIKTSGGLETVNLYPENFPKHLHWSTLLTGMPSVNAAPPTPNMKSGGQGTTIMMNDPRSGGIKYCSASGTGPYKFDTEQFGTDTAINHTNMPAYLIMSVYQVS